MCPKGQVEHGEGVAGKVGVNRQKTFGTQNDKVKAWGKVEGKKRVWALTFPQTASCKGNKVPIDLTLHLPPPLCKRKWYLPLVCIMARSQE